jgi:hypothetical protein
VTGAAHFRASRSRFRFRIPTTSTQTGTPPTFFGITALFGVIQLLHWRLGIPPLPIHPFTMLSLLTQTPGVLVAIPLMMLEGSLSEVAVGRLEAVTICAVFVAQATFFSFVYYLVN